MDFPNKNTNPKPYSIIQTRCVCYFCFCIRFHESAFIWKQHEHNRGENAAQTHNLQDYTSFIQFKTRKIHFSDPMWWKNFIFPVIEEKSFKQKLILLWRDVMHRRR